MTERPGALLAAAAIIAGGPNMTPVWIAKACIARLLYYPIFLNKEHQRRSVSPAGVRMQSSAMY